MARFSLSALGADRPGIVAAVTGALVDLGCNLEDSTMTILRGHFAILLVVAAPEGVGEDAIAGALASAADAFDLTVAVRPITSAAAEASQDTERESWTVAVHGADRPGIVHAVTSALAETGGNVVDLATHLVGEKDAPVYVLTIRAALPAGAEGDEAAKRVRDSASSLGVHCVVHRDEADVL